MAGILHKVGKIQRYTNKLPTLHFDQLGRLELGPLKLPQRCTSGSETLHPKPVHPKSTHTPYPALPCPALPCPALPCPALPCPALPCPALPAYLSGHYVRNVVMDVITFPENLQTTSGLSILLHGVISFRDARDFI